MQREMVALLAKQHIKVDYTEDLAEMQAPRLNAYSAVIFFSTSRDTLDDGAKTALRQYMRAGGGFVGIHNAFGTMYNWPYYEGLLGGANYYDHGPFRSGDVVVVDSNDASTKGAAAALALRRRVVQLRALPHACALPRDRGREVVGAGRERLSQRRRRPPGGGRGGPHVPGRRGSAPALDRRRSRGCPRWSASTPATARSILWPGASTTTAARPG